MSNAACGLYSYQFCGGPGQNTTFQMMHQTLNEARGTAYNTSPGTIVWCENYALASAITGVWTLMDHFKAELVPSTSVEFLPRWEHIYGISSNPNATIQQRQMTLAGKMAQWSQPPTLTNVTTTLKNLLGPTFVGVELNQPTDGYAAMPADTYTNNPHALNNYTYVAPSYNNPSGGVNLSGQGGVVLPAGDFYGNLYWLRVRVWQPRDQFGNLLMSQSDFFRYINNYQSFMLGYLPAYCLLSTEHFEYRPIQVDGVQHGGIEANAGTNILTGIGTYFDGYSSGQYVYPPIRPGDPIEVVDSTNTLQTYYVDTVVSQTSITTTTTILNAITYVVGNFRTWGWILDTYNLDGMCATGNG